jgi:hypothetical protein
VDELVASSRLLSTKCLHQTRPFEQAVRNVPHAHGPRKQVSIWNAVHSVQQFIAD